jgi:hypothetical protein
VAVHAPVQLSPIIPARLQSDKTGLTNGRVTASFKDGLIPVSQAVEFDLKVEELCCFVGKYEGHLIVDGQGLKEPASIQVIVIVTDWEFFLALAITIGVGLSWLLDKTTLTKDLLGERKGLSWIGLALAIVTGIVAVGFLQEEYFGMLRHYLAAIAWGASVDTTTKSPAVRRFLTGKRFPLSSMVTRSRSRLAENFTRFKIQHTGCLDSQPVAPVC